MVQTIIIEEHNEAFLVWNWGKNRGIIPDSQNVLFHVDEHSDLGSPRLKNSAKNLDGNSEALLNMTYNELSIANFIIPAVYQGLIGEVYWIRQEHDTSKKVKNKRFVRSYNSQGKKLITMPLSKEIEEIRDEDRKTFNIFLNKIEDIPSDQEVILDIDLDFFSSIDNPSEYQDLAIEITEEEYIRFTQDRYHPLNFHMGGKIEAVKEGEKFFYAIDHYEERYLSKKKVDERTVESRIIQFVKLLKEKKINPHLIDVCKSTLSGFTPGDQCEFIQKRLLEQLGEVYDLDTHYINELVH